MGTESDSQALPRGSLIASSFLMPSSCCVRLLLLNLFIEELWRNGANLSKFMRVGSMRFGAMSAAEHDGSSGEFLTISGHAEDYGDEMVGDI